MTREETHERNLQGANMTRITAMPAEAGDQKGMRKATMKARAESRRSNQATLSKSVARRIEVNISAPKAVEYFRNLETHGGFIRDGRGALEKD